MSNFIGHFTGPSINYVLTHKDAMPPTKSHKDDSGFDLNLVKLIKKKGKVEYYSTGVKANIPNHFPDSENHWYFELYARSSLVKTGYQLANGVGIIDHGYTGEIIAALIKFDKDAPDLKLPDRLVQIIPRVSKTHYLEEVKILPKTERNVGGFGSTNNNENKKRKLK